MAEIKFNYERLAELLGVDHRDFSDEELKFLVHFVTPNDLVARADGAKVKSAHPDTFTIGIARYTRGQIETFIRWWAKYNEKRNEK